jgi:Undecaprenyl pyrophosphate synthase
LKKNILKHISIILDGNNRWAQNNKLPTIEGYKAGFENIKKIVEHCTKLNIKDLTLFTLSSENYNRPSLNIIFDLIKNNFSKTLNDLINKGNIKINIFGSRNNLPENIINIFEKTEKQSMNNYGLNLNLAFNYGFKDEIKDVINNYNNIKHSIDLEKKSRYTQFISIKIFF